MIENVGKILTNVGLASVGLAALAAEQVGKAGKCLVEKGAVALEEGRKYSSQVQQQYKEAAQRRREEQFDLHVCQMNAQQREELRRRLAELDELEKEVAGEDVDPSDLEDDDTQAF